MIKRILLPIAVIAVFSSCGDTKVDETINTDIIDNPISADNTNVKEAELPSFEFVEEIKDFGEITQGEIVSTTFRFRNVGESDLIISSATGSCGCTVPEWPREAIAPGETAKMKVTYATNRVGPINKTVTITSNSSTGTTKVVRIKGEVLKPAPEDGAPVIKTKSPMLKS